MYRSMVKVGVCAAIALGLWTATPEAQAQRRGWGGRGWSSPGISFGVDRGGFYAGPSYGRYGGWDGYGRYGWDGYGRSGYGSRFWDQGWYGSTYWPRSYSYGTSPRYYSYSYPSTYYYSTPGATYSYPSTTYYESSPAATYSEAMPSTTYRSSASTSVSRSQDSARIRVHVPEPTAQLWFNDSPTQQRGMERVFETPPLRDDRTNTYEIRAKWQDEDGRTIERTQTVRVEPGAQEVVSFEQTE